MESLKVCTAGKAILGKHPFEDRAKAFRVRGMNCKVYRDLGVLFTSAFFEAVIARIPRKVSGIYLEFSC
jgi:hypothetical protein